MKIVLADPPVFESRYDNTYPNTGVPYVLARIRKAQSELDVQCLESHCNLRERLTCLNRERPGICGLSFSSKTFRPAKQTTASVGARFPEILMVYRGSHATAMPEQVIADTVVDVVVVGACEEPMA